VNVLQERISALGNVSPITKERFTEPDRKTNANGQNFATALKTALNHISEIEHESNLKTKLLAQGKIDNLHDVMITAQKTNITVETAVQIQQKVIDSYNEVMRMQV